MSQADVDTIRRGYADLNRRDVDAWLDAFHPDVEMYDLAGVVRNDSSTMRSPPRKDIHARAMIHRRVRLLTRLVPRLVPRHWADNAETAP